MLGSKNFEKVIITLTAIILTFSVVLTCFPGLFSFLSPFETEYYTDKLFKKHIINVNITVDENTWQEMLDDRMSKPYIPCDIEIEGKVFSNVGIRPKGNSSLTSIQGDRISFRLDFDHYVDNQNCFGLEQMVLNNLQADATYMKDYIAYDLMEYMEVKAPLHTHAFITLNGNPFGVYLAVEVYNEDYLERAFNDTDVNLYNVKSSGLDEFENAEVDSENASVVKTEGTVSAASMGMGGPPPGPPPGMDGNMMPPGMPMGEMGGNMMPPGPPPGGPGGPGGGGDLVYTDDKTESYSTIFANSVFDHTNADDYAKVIRAIKYLNKEDVTIEELQNYWDVDAVLRYLAVHAFMVNGDSYTGNMNQNYYLAEQDGRLTMLPWDYNLSFGAFGGGPGGGPGGAPSKEGESADLGGMVPPPPMMDGNSANQTTEVINQAIDTPVIGVDMESRPLVSVLLGNESCKTTYHKYLNELTQYASGAFIGKLDIVENAIYEYIEKETVSFYTPEAHKKGFEVLKSFLRLRSASIQGQLNGTIPSKTEQQTGANLITADFSINDMGTMGGPGGMEPPGGFGGPGGMQTFGGPGGPGGMEPPGEFGGPGMPPPPMGQMPQANTNNGIITIFAVILLIVVMAAIRMFRRYY